MTTAPTAPSRPLGRELLAALALSGIPLVASGTALGGTVVLAIEGSTTAAVVAGVVCLGLAVVAAVTTRVAHRQVVSRVVEPLGAIATAAHRIEQGVLDVRVEGEIPVDELAEIAAAFDAMAAGVRQRVTDLDTAHAASEEARLALARSNRELEHFAYAASHDLQAPLRTVAGFIELLDQHLADQGVERDERYTHYRDRIVAGTLTMHQLIDGLLRYSRVHSQGGALDEEVDLGAALGDVGDALVARLDQVGGTIVPGPLPTVWGNALQLRQLMQNLVDNALKYHHPARPPVVRVDAERDHAAWVVSVRDNGVGVPAGMEDKAFQMFKRLHPTTGRTDEGIGMGLALCRRIAERHGGTIWIEHEPDGGTAVRVRLPDDPPPIPTEELDP